MDISFFARQYAQLDMTSSPEGTLYEHAQLSGHWPGPSPNYTRKMLCKCIKRRCSTITSIKHPLLDQAHPREARF